MSGTMDPMATEVDQQELAQQLLAQAREQGIDLVGPDGLLNRLTKNVLETALEAEMDEHLGYEKHDVSGRGSGNSRNGTRTKTVLTEIGPVEIDVPRDTGATFDPQIVNKRQRRLTGVDEIVLSLSAKGLTTGEIAAHFAEVFGARVSKDTISRITEKVIGEMTEWQNRPLDRVYPVVFIDAIHVKVRDGQVTNRPVYVAIGVSVNGERDILGLWAGDGGEGREVLALGADRDQEPGRGGRLHHGLRRAQGPARGHHHGVGAGRGPDLHRAPDPQHLPLCRPAVLGRHVPGSAPGLHGTVRGRGEGTLRGVLGQMGPAVPGDHPAVGERVERVRAVPGLRRRNPAGHLQHQRHRIPQRPLPARGEGQGPFPHRAGGPEMPVPGDPGTGPHRQGQGTMGHHDGSRP